MARQQQPAPYSSRILAGQRLFSINQGCLAGHGKFGMRLVTILSSCNLQIILTLLGLVNAESRGAGSAEPEMRPRQRLAHQKLQPQAGSKRTRVEI